MKTTAEHTEPVKTQKSNMPLFSKANGGNKSSFFFQSKMTVNQPNDICEQEADAMADKVMGMPYKSVNQIFFKPAEHSIIRKCTNCKEEDKELHRKESGVNNSTTAPPIIHDVLNSSNGISLDANTRSFFEPRFGHDFSNVKIHDDSLAAKSAQSINSLAYTSGNNIVFNENQYSPNTESGKKLLAHELTHVVQQRRSGEIKRIQTFQLPIPSFFGVPDIYIEPIPHTHPLIPCVSIPVTHIGVVARMKGPLSTGKGKIIFDLHIGFYRDPTTGRACFVIFESLTKYCIITCFPNWDDVKRAWDKIRDAIVEALRYFFAAAGIVVAAWLLYLIADAIATALIALLAVAAVA